MTTTELLTIGMTNAVLATVLAVCGWVLTRVWKNPHVASVVWLVVLLKLVTPPLVTLPIEWSEQTPLAKELGAATVAEWESKSEDTSASPVEAVDELLFESDPFVESLNAQAEEGIGIEQAQSDAAGWPLTPGSSPEREGSEFAGEVPTFESATSKVEESLVGLKVEVPLTTASEEVLPAVSSPVVVSNADRQATSWSLLRIYELVAPVVLAVWLMGGLVAAGVAVWRVLRFGKLLHIAAATDEGIATVANDVAARMSLQRWPEVRSVSSNVGPLVWAGGIRPTIVVPRPLWDSIGEAEREILLAHELAHVARRDHWVRRVEAVVLALYWWLPTAWIAVRRREVAAELCCDAIVLKTYPDRPRAYAEVLFHAVSQFSASRPVVLASGLGRISELKERLAMIVHDRIPKRPRMLTRLGLLVLGGAALFVSAQFVKADPKEGAAEGSAGPVVDAPAAQAADEASFAGENDALPDPFGSGASVRPYDEAHPFGARASVPPYDKDNPFGSRGSRPSYAQADPYGGKDSEEALPELEEILPDEGPYRSTFEARGTPGFSSGSRNPAAASGSRTPAAARRAAWERRNQDKLSVARASENTLAKLREVIQSKNEPAAVKVQAIRSYGRLARGTGELAAADKVLTEVAKSADSDRLKLAAAEALHTLGSPKGVEVMWSLLERSEDPETLRAVVVTLDKAKAVPPTVESVIAVVTRQAAGLIEGGGAMGMGGRFGPRTSSAGALLARLGESAEGIRRLVKAIETIKVDAGMEGGYGDEMPFGPEGGYGGAGLGMPGMAPGGMGGFAPPNPREALLMVLREVKPETDEITDALVAALSSKDANVRAAAAQALGNPVEAKEARGGTPGMEAGVARSMPAGANEPVRSGTMPAAARGGASGVPVQSAAETRGSSPFQSVPPIKEMPESSAISDRVRAELIKSLSAAATDEKASPETRAAALESLAKMAEGTEQAAEVTEIAKRVLEQAADASEKAAAAAALQRLGDSQGVEALWGALAMSKPEESASIIERLAASKMPGSATAEGVVALAWNIAWIERKLTKFSLNPRSAEAMRLSSLQNAGNNVLLRIPRSGQGLNAIVAAIESLEAERLAAGTAEEGMEIEQAKTRLLALLKSTKPTNDEIASALAQALHSDVGEVRTAAAEALGNVSGEEEIDKREETR